MTRQEFIESVTDWSDLIDFCNEESLSYCDEIVDDYSKNEYYDERIFDWASECGCWQDLLDMLNDIPTGYDYYIYDEYGSEYRGADDEDFDNIKEDVIETMDANERWDDEEEYEEEEYEDECEEEEEDLIEPEPFSISELMSDCKTSCDDFKNDIDKINNESERMLIDLCSTTQSI